MHSPFTRATVVLFFALSVLMIAAMAATLSSMLLDDHSDADARVVGVSLRGLAADHREKADAAHLVVSLDADFTR